MIITIGRELGAGGRKIGQRLAQALNLRYYDKELILEAAQRSGMCPALFEQIDEKPNRLLYAMSTIHPELFLIQSQTIEQLAQKGNCVFVGRLADFILRERNDCFSIFLTASKQDRNQNLQERLHLTEKQASDLISKTDRQRADYYNFYTHRQWGAARYYDLCLNTSFFDLDQCVELILKGLETKHLLP